MIVVSIGIIIFRELFCVNIVFVTVYCYVFTFAVYAGCVDNTLSLV
jgi:hypothetical protein